MTIKHVACTLLGAVIFLIAATTGTAVAHELQHAAHHTAGMHGTGLCAWMCATTAAESAASIHYLQILAVTERLSLCSERALLGPVLVSGSSRAPPILA
jgi:hypothetical protein